MSRQSNTLGSILENLHYCVHGFKCHECCWIWQGAKDRWGYGKATVKGETVIVHRFIYKECVKKDITNADFVLHTCDNALCGNWHHLYVGTHQKNMKDMVERERQATRENGRYKDPQRKRGVEQSQSKLTDDKVRQMRRLYYLGGYTQEELASLFNIKKSVTGRILTSQDWQHVRPYSFISG